MASSLIYHNRYDYQPSPSLTKSKQRYYLASSNENIQMLSEHQSKELSSVLFELRTQHDKLTLDCSTKAREEAELRKKITQITSRDKEISKYIKEKQLTLSSVQSLAEMKQKKKIEESYNKRILSSNVSKMSLDILLTQKSANGSQEEQNKLEKAVNKSIIFNNNQKSKYNTMHLKLISQNERNETEKEDQILQLEYYQEIIEQKASFIQSADERKMKQQQIAEKAKNNTNDINEIAIRRKLLLLKIVNHYYALKMDKMLKDNEELEESYSNIRDICGNGKLAEICSILCEKDRIYSYKTSLAQERQKQKKQLKAHLQTVQKQYQALLTEVVVALKKEEGTTIEVLHSTRRTKENDLIEKEKALSLQLEKCREKQLIVELAYKKTIENINHLYKAFFCDKEKGKFNPTESINQTKNLITLETNELSFSRAMEAEESKDNNEINDKKIIDDYSEFLKSSFDSFNKLFFCYSKHEFIKALRERGIEKVSESITPSSRKMTRTLTKTSLSNKVNHRSSIRERTKRLYLSVSTEGMRKPHLEEDGEEEDEIFPKEKQAQKDIMANFLEEVKREKEEYIRCARRKKTLTSTTNL